MQDSNFILYIAIEIAAVLLILSIFLIISVKKFKAHRLALEAEIVELRDSLASEKNSVKALKEKSANEIKALEEQANKSASHVDSIDQLLDATNTFYDKIHPEGMITLDIGADVPAARLACSLRYAYLMAEKEALYEGGEGDAKEEARWSILQTKLLQVLDLYTDFNIGNVTSVPASESTSLVSENEEHVASLENKIAEMQQQHLNLQTQYIELEERYNELKEN